MSKLIRWVLYSLYLTLTGSGIVYLAAGMSGNAPWAGVGMLLAASMLGYAVSGFVKRRTALAAIAAALISVAATMFLLPYGGWNVIMVLLNVVCVILGARHKWEEVDTRLIEIRLFAAGLVVSTLTYVIAVLNACDAPQPQIGYTMYGYICLTVLLVNRRSVQLNAGTQAGRMMRSNQMIAWGFVAVFTLAVFFGPLQKAVGGLIRSAITALINLFNSDEPPRSFTPNEAIENEELDLSALGGEVKEWPQWLQVLSDIFLYTITILVLLALAAGLIYAIVRACKELSKYLKNWFSTFGSNGNEEYSEESEQLMSAQSMRRQFQEDLTRRVKRLFERPVRWGALTPNERVRHVYKRLLEQEKQITASAENLTPQELCARAEKEEGFAALYGRVRYAEETVAVEEAEKYRSYLKN